MKLSSFLSVAALAAACAALTPAALALTGDETRAATGIQSGLAVHIGCGDGSLVRDLAKEGRFLTQGLTTDAAAAATAREASAKAGLAGLATFDHPASFATLPYNDNLVTLVIADLDALGAAAPKSTDDQRRHAPGIRKTIRCRRTRQPGVRSTSARNLLLTALTPRDRADLHGQGPRAR